MKKIFILLLIGILAHSSLAGRTVYITRHGQVGDTEYFDKAVREIKLTPLGKEQAQMLAEYLTDVKKFRGTVCVSPLYRTIETGIYIADRLNGKVILEPGIQEVAPGKTRRGMNWKEIESRFPGKTVSGKVFTDDWRLSQENPAARLVRVSNALDRILSEHRGDLLLVAHAAIVGDLVSSMNGRCRTGVSKVKGTAWNCSLFIFELDENDHVIQASYTTEYMPDEKVTSNFRTPKIPRLDDSRYENRAVKKEKTRSEKRSEAGNRMIYITRHCQATGKKGKDIIRPVLDDGGITELGVRQSYLLGKELKRLGFKGMIFASPYFRTVATACAVAEECGVKVYPDARVQERCKTDGGNLKQGGATLGQLRKLFPEQIAEGACLSDAWILKSKEDFKAHKLRIKKALDEILAENPGKDILIVTHGGAVGAFCMNLMGKMPPRKHFIWNCSLFRCSVGADGRFRYLGYDISFIPEEAVTSNFKYTLKDRKAGRKKDVKSGVDYEL